MKTVALLFCWFSVVSLWGADPELFSIADDSVGTDFPELVEREANLLGAIGFVERTQSSKTIEVQTLNQTYNASHLKLASGFFISPSLFLSVRSPDSLEVPEASSVRIYTSRVQALKDRKGGKGAYRVRRVMQSNPRYGFIVYEIEGSHPEYLKIGALEKGSPRPREWAVVGYSELGSRYYSKNCVLARESCSFCRTKEKEWGLEMTAWGMSRCLFKAGMAGSPLVARGRDGNWMALGMLGSLVGGSEDDKILWNQTFDEVSVIKLRTLQTRFGSDLTGRHRS